MEKVIRDGKVAVLYSPSFGAGWYSWNSEHPQLIFHPELVKMVEEDRREEITDQWVEDNLGIEIYTGGARDLKIAWLDEGQRFLIDEYDGNEGIQTVDDLTLIA